MADMLHEGHDRLDPAEESHIEASAAAAWERGQAALAAGDGAMAERWLDRANRLAPHDPLFRLALATATLPRDPARAGEIFAELAATQDVREVWLGLATAHWRCGAAVDAAIALGHALSRHVTPADTGWMRLADQLAPGGWCAVGPGEKLLLGGALPRTGFGKLRITLDERALRARPDSRLPRGWTAGHWLRVARDGQDVCGSPIDIRALRRLAGRVAWDEGEIAGWAWYPGDPLRVPVLRVRMAQGETRRLITQHAVNNPIPGWLLARPHRFRVCAPTHAGPLRVTDADGQDVPGSPIMPAAIHPGSPFREPPKSTPRARGTAIVVPVYADCVGSLACLESVLSARPRRVRVIVVDDATPEPALAAALDALAARRRISLIRHATNQGFPASANAGFAAAGGRDVLLLNSDTLVGPDFVERLRNAAYSAADIATACPLSNDATILSYPAAVSRNPMPDLPETVRLAALAARANGTSTVPIPTPVGFCMFVRHDALAAGGGFRADIFGPGYGEENDFAMRARDAGWRHVAVPGVFVAHAGEASFGAMAPALRQRAQAILARLHPTYDALIAAHVAADPLAPARRRLDLARWRAARVRGGRAVLLVTHDHGGGVEKAVQARAAALRRAGQRPILLRPTPPTRTGIRLEDDGGAYPNLRFRLPDDLPALLRLLHAEHPDRMEIHHTLGHAPQSLQLPHLLGIPHDVIVHDYAWFCPRIVLSDSSGRYCGEPDLAGCVACVKTHGNRYDPSLSVAALRRHSATLLRGATEVTVASADSATRLAGHFRGLRLALRAPDDDAAPVAIQALAASRPRHVAVIGAIGPEKGLDILCAVARDAARRDLPLRFTLVGHSTDDEALLATGKIFVTGEYRPDEAHALIHAQQADLAFLPSLVPETWCFTLTEAWAAGLGTVVFDIGAQGERVRRTGRGLVLPLGLPAAAINDALLAARW